MTVLVLNCGSSSLKFRVMAFDAGSGGVRERRLAEGKIERIGGAAFLSFRAGGAESLRRAASVPDHRAAVRTVAAWIGDGGRAALAAGGGGVDGVGHRIVHGGERFTAPVLIDESVASAIDALEELAPLHNPPGLAGVRAAREVFGTKVPMVAVFDTAFHARLPERSRLYAVPRDLALRRGIRRYGFHGISYQYLLSRYCALAEVSPAKASFVAFHLGNGCSAAAVKEGRSIDTSMGMTPLEGLVMGTRSGDLDPGVFAVLAREEGMSPDDAEEMLNRRSGLLGLSALSPDMRDLLERERHDPRARLAVEIFCYRAKKYLGAYLAALGGADAVVFSGGIGENAPEVRARICEGMEWCGIRIDPSRNAALAGTEGEIGPKESRVRLLVIPTDEELLIARETVAVLARSAGPP